MTFSLSRGKPSFDPITSGDQAAHLQIVVQLVTLALHLSPPRHIFPGAPSVSGVCGNDPGFSLRGPRSRAFAAVQLASGFFLERRFLARVAPPGSCPASCSRPVGPEPGLKPRLNLRLEVSFC